MQAALKTLAPLRNVPYLTPLRLLKFEHRRQSPLAGRVMALQRVVAEMREELNGSRERETHARDLAFHDELTERYATLRSTPIGTLYQGDT